MPLRVALLGVFLAVKAYAAAAAPTSPYFEQAVADSNPLRLAQANELEAYVQAMKPDEAALREVLRPDYSSPPAFVASVANYRELFCQRIGYPPRGAPAPEPASFVQIGEDGIGIYYRVQIAILPAVHAEGIYIVPKGTDGPRPLVIAMHGGGGSPELALFHGGSNYHDMVRGGVKRGYAVFAPQHLFSSPGVPRSLRNTLDQRMRLIGTSITAVEIAKITRSLDVLLKRPEVDAQRVGMVGLSYGGFYSLVTAAVDQRIRVAVCSCYYGVQEGRYSRDELTVPSDFQFMDRMSLFRDADLAALICPRALQIQAGDHDDSDHRDPGLSQAPTSAAFYAKLGLSDRFQHIVFAGKHEFHDESAWTFVAKHL